MTPVAAVSDDLCHVRFRGVNSHLYTYPLTVCGKKVVAGRPTGGACHVCLPSEAHPLAAVWAQCRAIDERLNADLERTG